MAPVQKPLVRLLPAAKPAREQPPASRSRVPGAMSSRPGSWRTLDSAPVALVWLVLLTISFHHDSRAAETAPGNAPPGASFTSVQNLDPDTKPLNRPIQKKWAVVIGIGKFQDRRLNSEKALDKAARGFYSYLIDPEGGRFSPTHVRKLINEEATFQNINNSFGPSWLGSLAGPDDLVLVYLATQSFPTTDKESYLCTYNCSPDNIYGSCISVRTLLETLKSKLKSDRIVLVIESSYAGSTRLSNPRPAPAAALNIDLNRLVLGRGFIVASSSQEDQNAPDTIFSDKLIASLRENGGMTPFHEAFRKARQLTAEHSRALFGAVKQTPVIKSDWTGQDLIIGAPPLDEGAELPEAATVFLGAESHYLRASQAMSAGDTTTAIKEYRAAIAADPSYVDAVADYGVALALEGKWDEAEKQLQLAIDKRPEDALYRANHARALEALGKERDCIGELERAYALNPKDRTIICALADKCIVRGQKARAVELLTDASALYPTCAPVYSRLGFVLSAQGKLNDALQAARKAVDLDPSLPSARMSLGSLLLSQDEPEAAADQYRAVCNLSPQNTEALYLLGQALSRTSDIAGAREAFQQYLEASAADAPYRAQAREQLDKLTREHSN